VRFQGGLTLSGTLEACRVFLKARPPRTEDLPSGFPSLDDPEHSGPESLTIVSSGVRSEVRNQIQAALILAEEDVTGLPESVPVIRVTDARRVLAAVIHAFASRIKDEAPFVGDGTVVEQNAVIQRNCVIGENCVIQPGAVIGCAGFGFMDSKDGLEPMPHLAGVRIGDDCFIGANTVIAAGVLHPTEIGDGCKLDSHVQIAHNVRLGRGCLLASQSGIAGSTTVGDGLRMGGAASIAGHLRIGNNVSVAAKSGVTKDIPDGMTVAGFPARPIREWRRQQIFLRNTGETK
jgi:acyl-[acyl carrier protein]--UDP-N-acetylglucosamine O-acyltransferase